MLTARPPRPCAPPQGASTICVDALRRICRRLHVPAGAKEKKEVLGPYKLAVAKISAGVPLQVRKIPGGGVARQLWGGASGPALFIANSPPPIPPFPHNVHVHTPAAATPPPARPRSPTPW